MKSNLNIYGLIPWTVYFPYLKGLLQNEASHDFLRTKRDAAVIARN